MSEMKEISRLPCNTLFIWWRHLYLRPVMQNFPQILGATSKILGASMIAWSKFQKEHPQTLGTTAENLLPTANRRPGIVNSWLR